MKHRFGPPPPTDYDIHPSQDEIDAFRENGFLVVERMTTDEEVTWMRQIFELIFSPEEAAQMSAPVDRSGTNEPGFASSLSQAFFPEMRFPELLQTAHWRNARRYAAALLGVDESELTSWGHMIRKLPGGRSAPWHQDHAYWEPEFDYKALGVWLPMQETTVEMGAMQFVRGSHKRGLMEHRHDDKPENNLLAVADPFDPEDIVPCPLRLGGATFHHSETLHYTAPNTTDRARLAYPIEFQTKPMRRSVPEVMSWVDERRAALGGAEQHWWMADGKAIPL